MKINYNNKKFKVVQNSNNGDVSMDMVFQYHQVGHVLFCEYDGANIYKGHLLGVVNEDSSIDMSYHQIDSRGEIKTGVCNSTRQLLDNGKILLHERWRWTSGDGSSGTSTLEEI